MALNLYLQMNELMDGYLGGWVGGWIEGWLVDGWIDRWIERANGERREGRGVENGWMGVQTMKGHLIFN